MTNQFKNRLFVFSFKKEFKQSVSTIATKTILI
jgi:hypothetical protein